MPLSLDEPLQKAISSLNVYAFVIIAAMPMSVSMPLLLMFIHVAPITLFSFFKLYQLDPVNCKLNCTAALVNF